MKYLVPFALSSLLLSALPTQAPAFGQGLYVPRFQTIPFGQRLRERLWPVDKSKKVFQIRCIPQNWTLERLLDTGPGVFSEELINLDTREWRMLARSLRSMEIAEFSVPITEVTPAMIVAKSHHGDTLFVYTFSYDWMEAYWEQYVNGVKKADVMSTCIEVKITS